jgi:pyridoxine 4-dehydrogenase
VNATPKLRLGETEVARIGLGTNRLTRTAERVAFVREAVVAGVNVIDTAHTYAGGQSEEAIGAALSSIPDGCIVATKGGWNGARPETLRAEIEESLRRLRTDSIALYYLHRVDPQTPLEESLGAIKEYRDSGKIRQVGVSNVGSSRSSGPVRSFRSRPSKIVSICPSAPTTTSSTTAPARASCSFPIFRSTATGAPRSPRSPTDIAPRRRRSLSRLAAQALPTMLPIPGTRSVEHVRENVAALHIELNDAEFQALW